MVNPSARLAALNGRLTARIGTEMLRALRGEGREFGLTGLTRNQVSLTAPGVRIPPSPPYMDPALQVPSFENFWGSGCGHIFGFLVSEFGLSLEP